MNCKGCLRCNLIQRCAIRGDEWETLHVRILKADILAFASPIYFHHLTAPLKKILDRFRSFMQVRLTERGIHHTPWEAWEKQFVLFLSMGSPDAADAKPVIDLFTFLTAALGPGNKLHTILGTRLVVPAQVTMPLEELARLYNKLLLPMHLADHDYQRNQALLQSSYDLGRRLAAGKGDQ